MLQLNSFFNKIINEMKCEKKEVKVTAFAADDDDEYNFYNKLN